MDDEVKSKPRAPTSSENSVLQVHHVHACLFPRLGIFHERMCHSPWVRLSHASRVKTLGMRQLQVLWRWSTWHRACSSVSLWEVYAEPCFMFTGLVASTQHSVWFIVMSLQVWCPASLVQLYIHVHSCTNMFLCYRSKECCNGGALNHCSC